MIAIISDVHANLTALQAVLDALDGVHAIYCAGDVVGYGPDPEACCEVLRERGVQCVKGNHDHVCATLTDVGPASPMARESFEWTHERLSEDSKEWLEGLPLQINVDGMSIVHGAPGSAEEMLNAYVLDYYYSDDRYDELLRRVPGKRLVCGHTHIPLSHGFNAKVLNPGSVGQPRDGDWRASYVTVEDIRYDFRLVPTWRAGFNLMKDLVKFHRVEYDLETTLGRITSEPGLPRRLTKFLQHGGLRI